MRLIIIRSLIAVGFILILSLGILAYVLGYPKPKLQGQWLAFGCNGHIYLMREDGTGKHLLLPLWYGDLGSPTWSTNSLYTGI